MRRPVSLGSIALYGHRSLPQMPACSTATTASVSSSSLGSGTSSTRTSKAPYMTVARIAPLSLSGRDLLAQSLELRANLLEHCEILLALVAVECLLERYRALVAAAAAGQHLGEVAQR